jgi:hypothetical protein
MPNATECYAAKEVSLGAVKEAKEESVVNKNDKKSEKKCNNIILENSIKTEGNQRSQEKKAEDILPIAKSVDEVIIGVGAVSIVEKNIPQNSFPPECSSGNKEESSESEDLKQVSPEHVATAAPVLDSVTEEGSSLGNMPAETVKEAETVIVSEQNMTKTELVQNIQTVQTPHLIVNNVKTIKKAKSASAYYLSLSEDNKKKEFCLKCKEFEEKYTVLSVPLQPRYWFIILSIMKNAISLTHLTLLLLSMLLYIFILL